MRLDYSEPLNLVQDRLVTINPLVYMIAEVAGVEVNKKHIPGPQGVRGRNSDNTRLRQILAWGPEISMEAGLAHTYAWIEDRFKGKIRVEQGEYVLYARAAID
jgi:GDP-D-mannose 3',5'-epimerase